MTPGQIVSHYRILEKLGEGGMGVVWKAEDTKLKRTVALKFVPSDAADDAELCARFRQEAQAAASLSHPNVCTVFEIDEECGFLAMEFVEGETAQSRARRRPLPVAEALDIVIQAAQGLAAAHEKGVVHRDIKSANLMVTPTGAVKIMDFGLARLTGRTRVTRAGTTMGTPAYMSPEQALGKEADRRTDLWSLGAVLYETVTGQLPFKGETEAAVVYSLLHDDPEPVTGLRAGLPLELDRVIAKALAKDLGERYQHAEDFLVDLRTLRGRLQLESGTTRRAAAQARRRRWAAAALGTALLIVGTGAGFYFGAMRSAVSDAPLRKFQLGLGADAGVAVGIDTITRPMISPDGTKMAYTKGRRLWIWDLQKLTGREISGTEGATGPFWSPDGTSVAFLAGRTVRRVNVEKGSLTNVGEITSNSGNFLGGSWSSSGSILIGIEAVGLLEAPARGGEFKIALAPDHAKGEYDFHTPQYLPDGKSYLYTRHMAADFKLSLCVHSGQTVRCGLEGASGVAADPVYDSRGYLLYEGIRGGKSVLAAPFSLRSLTVSGEPFVVAESAGGPSVSRDGVLTYFTDSSTLAQELVLVDRTGKFERIISEPFEMIRHPAVSPDGSRVAMSGSREGNLDIWVYDVTRSTSIRITSGAELDQHPAWSPGGDLLAFTSGPVWGSKLCQKRSDGSGDTSVLSLAGQNTRSTAWAPDGRQIVYSVRREDLKPELWVTGPDGGQSPRSLPGASGGASDISPDGGWLAYESQESGRSEVYVVPFPKGEGRWAVSPRGGHNPHWSRRGDELFYIEGNSLMVLPVATKPAFRAGSPRELIDGGKSGLLLYSWGPSYATYDVTPDGQHFVAVRPAGEVGKDSVTLVENWLREFRK